MDLLAAAVAACAVDDDHDVKLQLRHYWLGLPACAQGIPDDVAGATFMAAGASSPVRSFHAHLAVLHRCGALP